MEGINYVHVKNQEAIEFADWLLTHYEMDSFPLLHPKRNSDEDLCWRLGGTEQRYTTEEMYDIFEEEKYKKVIITTT